MMHSIVARTLAAVVMAALLAPGAMAQGTSFTYQGQLVDAGRPANGSYDVRSILFDAEIGGSQIGVIITNLAVPVASGVMTATLDFGAGAFTGASRWLELAVRAALASRSFRPANR